MSPLASYFWSAPPLTPGMTFGVALVGVVVGLGVGYLIHRMTAAGVEMAPPADGAEVAAEPGQTGSAGGSAGPDRAAPAPGAPALPTGAPGVTPDDFPWFDPRSVREAEQADEVAAIVGGR